MGHMINAYKFWSENLKGGDQLEELGVNGKILKSMLKKQDLRVLNGFIC
jgi:hypothetical protein